MSRTISRSQGICCSVTKLADGLLRSPSFFMSDKLPLLGDRRDSVDQPGRLGPWAQIRGATRQTPVLSADQARQLLDTIEPSELIGLRDRALIGLMVSASRGWVRPIPWASVTISKKKSAGGSGT